VTVIRTLLCDLDDTLFDHSGATRDALAVVRNLAPAFQSWTLDELDRRHRVVLEALHLQVLAGRYTVEDARIERFKQLLAAAGVDESRMDVLDELSWGYRHAYEDAWRMVPGAVELVAAAKSSGWDVVIVTNNVVREQRLKIERGGLLPYVDALVTSEEFGASKPDPRIIHHAIERVGRTASASVVFGDSLITDIAGGRAAGVRVVWFNRSRLRTSGDAADASLPQLHSLEPAEDALRVLAGE